MTTAYRPDWTYPRQPELGELVDGDLCDITLCTGDGSARYCLHPAVHAAVDVDGRYRLLCAEHVAKYFPNALVAV